MYSVMAVVRVVFTFGLLTLIFNFFFPTIAIVILAILNDISMITISKDRVKVKTILFPFLSNFFYNFVNIS